MKRLIFIILSVFTFIGCSKDSSESTTTTTTSQETIVVEKTRATVNLTVVDVSQEPQPNYTIMMFDESVTQKSILPKILMVKISDVQGKVSFDLENYVQTNGEKKYYFEAFKKVDDNNYTYEGITNISFEVKSGHVYTFNNSKLTVVLNV